MHHATTFSGLYGPRSSLPLPCVLNRTVIGAHASGTVCATGVSSRRVQHAAVSRRFPHSSAFDSTKHLGSKGAGFFTSGRGSDWSLPVSLHGTIPAVASSADDPHVRPSNKTVRLVALVELRRLYRNLLRAKFLLDVPSPVYQPAPRLPADQKALLSPDELREKEEQEEVEEQEIRDAAVQLVAEMQLTAEQLKAQLRALPPDFDQTLGVDREGQDKILTLVKEYMQKLRERAQQELPVLPYASEAAAQQAVDARNAKYSRRQQTLSVSASIDESSLETVKVLGPIERLEQAEKVAEQFVARRIKPVLRKARETEFADLLKSAGPYLRGLWMRLNGGGDISHEEMLRGLDLPLPSSTKKESDLAISQISMELDALEKRLQEASKRRESKLRKAGIPGRVRMAIQLKLLDADVLALSRLLAVRTLQLEMEYVYRSLEDECLDITSSIGRDESLLTREGSTGELALLVADFGLLEEQLTLLRSALDSSTLSIVGDDILEKLAADIPDLRTRVGVADQLVFGGQGFNVVKLQLQVQESLGKVREGITFLVRGCKLMGSDVANATRLFTKAALGGTLKPREVSSLRRTARDILTFIPFVIILIIPLTPLGHVLVFGFIQTYFPSLFPSCFTSKRQDLMVRYEDLKRQLLEAQAQAEQAEEEAELARVAAAVARITTPTPAPSSPAAIADATALLDGQGQQDPVTESAAAKVAALAEQLDEMRDDVHLPILEDALEGTGAGAGAATEALIRRVRAQRSN